MDMTKPFIQINDKTTDNIQLVDLITFFNKVCCPLISKFCSKYIKYLRAISMDCDDLKQEMFIVLTEIVENNKKIEELSSEDIAKYLITSVNWRLMAILKTARETKNIIISNEYDDNIGQKTDVQNRVDNVLEYLEELGISLEEILKEVCTQQEYNVSYRYFFECKNIPDIATEVSLSKMRISQLVQNTLLKVNNKLKQIIK